MNYQEIRRELSERAAKDQAVRKKIEAMPLPEQKRVLNKEMKEVDEPNTAYIEELLNQGVEPIVECIGEDGARGFWLLVQHSTLEVMERSLALMLRLREEGETVYEDGLPLLIDRIRMFKGERQIYGTQYQFNPETETFEQYKMADAKEAERLKKYYRLRYPDDDAVDDKAE